MNQEPLHSPTPAPSQTIWVSRTDKLLVAAHRAQLTTANAQVTIARDGAPVFSSNLASLQVNSNGYSGTTLLKNDQGQVVRVMFSKIRTRALAVSPLIALMIVVALMDVPGRTGLNIVFLSASLLIYQQVEARSRARKQFIAAVAAAGGNINASFADAQAQAGWSKGRRIALAILSPIMCVVFSALIYAIAFGLLQSMSLMSPTSAFAPKVVLYVIIYVAMYKPTYRLLARLTDVLSGVTNIQPK